MVKRAKVGKPEEEIIDKIPEEEKIKSSKNEASIYDPDGNFIRTYTKELHGKDFEALAKGFAGKVAGRTVR